MKDKSNSSTKVIDMLPYIKVYYDFQENDIRRTLTVKEIYFLSWIEDSPTANQFYNYEQYLEIIPNFKTEYSLRSFKSLVSKLSKLGVIDIEKNKNNLSRFKIYSFDKTQLENKQQNQKDSSMPKFIPPTLNEVFDHANQFITNSNKYYVPDLDTECESFFDYYTNTDWKICQGRQKMKDWKLALHNWLRNASNKNKRFNRPFNQRGQYNGFMTKQEYISDSNRRLHEEWLKQRQEQQANQQGSNQQEQSNNVLTYDWLFTGNNK